MDYLAALYYGVIQGVTEFLPVSSSGHLALLPNLLDIKDPGVFFDLSMHLGTAFSVILYFRKDLLILGSEYLKLFDKNHPRTGQSYFALNLLISTVATFFLVLLIKKYAFLYGRSNQLIAINLIFFGLLMWFFDKRGTSQESNFMEKKIDFKRSIWVGLFQGLAVFPGVSRSGSTLTISRALGLSREESTRFSFLLSLPIIIGGFVFKLPELFSGQVPFKLDLCLLGILVSFIVGLITIHYFLKFIKKMGLGIFSFYRIILGFLILIGQAFFII